MVGRASAEMGTLCLQLGASRKVSSDNVDRLVKARKLGTASKRTYSERMISQFVKFLQIPVCISSQSNSS